MKKAFSLLELSVSLVIIGFIVGAVIIGSELVGAAKSKSVINQLEQIQTAMHNFNDKYSALPGDYKSASLNISEDALDGDGNYRIYQRNGNPTTLPTSISEVQAGETNEYTGVFNHLTLEKMLRGIYDGTQTNVLPGQNIPEVAAGTGGIIVYTDYLTGELTMYIGISENSTDGDIVTRDALTPSQAFDVDRKLDDGLIFSGKMQAFASFDSTSYTSEPATGSCQDTDGTLAYYDLKNNDIVCQLRYAYD